MLDTWTQTSISPDQGASQRWVADKKTEPARQDNSAIADVDSRVQVRTEPGQKTTEPDGRPRDSFELSREAEEIRQLQLRDQEVRAHEAAHAAAGGPHAGSPSYRYERGPDGKTYATEGEVSIDLSKVSGDPEATLQKAEQVRAAALAPAEPSAQDLKVAQKAQTMASQARIELEQKRSEDVSEGRNPTKSDNSSAAQGNEAEPVGQFDQHGTETSGGLSQGVTHLSIYS